MEILDVCVMAVAHVPEVPTRLNPAGGDLNRPEELETCTPIKWLGPLSVTVTGPSAGHSSTGPTSRPVPLAMTVSPNPPSPARALPCRPLGPPHTPPLGHASVTRAHPTNSAPHTAHHLIPCLALITNNDHIRMTTTSDSMKRQKMSTVAHTWTTQFMMTLCATQRGHAPRRRVWLEPPPSKILTTRRG